MGIWRSAEPTWTSGEGLRALQLFQRAYASPADLRRAAAQAGVDLEGAPSSDLPNAGYRLTLSLVAEQGKLPALAAVLLHDQGRAPLHPPLRQLLGDDLPAANVAFIRLFGGPQDTAVAEALLTEDTLDELAQKNGFEALNAPRAFNDSASARVRVIQAAMNRTALLRSGATAGGTGFLVGPDLLLTAAHLFPAAAWPPTDVSSLEAVFDYQDGILGETGMAVPVAAFLDGQLPADGEGPAAAFLSSVAVDRLDFALLRLVRQIGTVQGLGDGPRGWYRLQPAPYDYVGAPLLELYGHGGGRVLQSTHSVGKIRMNANGTRVQYTTNTEKGSSGSPVVDPWGRLVAVHHYSREGPFGNQGVPVWRIAEALLAGRYGAELNQPVPTVIAGSGSVQQPAAVQFAAPVVGGPNPFMATEIRGRPLVDRKPLRDRMWELAQGQGTRTLIIAGEVDSGVTTSYDILDHAAARSTGPSGLTAIAAQGLKAYRLDLRPYMTTPVAERRVRIMAEIYRWIEGNEPSERRVAQVAREVATFKSWARNAFKPGTQWWIFVDSIDTPSDTNQHGVDEVLHVLLELAEQSQLDVRVVLAGQQPGEVKSPLLGWAARDEAPGLLRHHVKEWLEERGVARGSPLSPAALEAELDSLFPTDTPPDPAQLQLDIALAARRLWT